MQRFSARLKEAKQLTSDVWHYVFAWEGKAIPFEAGQFFLIEVVDEAGKVTRAYSLASVPWDPEGFTFCVKLLEGGRASALFRNMKEGGAASFSGPFGHFILTDSPKDMIFVATGTGLAPFMSMLPALFEKKDPRKIRLLFGVRFESDLFYLEELDAWANKHSSFTYDLCVSRPEETWTGLKGRVTDALEALTVEEKQVYMCGNGDMIKSVKTMMESKGVPKTDIHWEQFTALKPDL